MADPRGDEALAELLRAAAPTTVPAAGFDHGTVLAAARRAQARRRQLLAGGAAAVVVVLAGGGAVAVLGGGAGEQSTASSAVAGSAGGSTGAGGIAPQVRPPDQLPEAPAGTAPGVGPQVPGPGTCGPTDGAVHAALQQALPELAARPPYPLDRVCPDGTTGAGVTVSAGGGAGRVEALVGPTAVTATDGDTGTATTADGRTVTIVSVPAAGSSAGPYADRLDDVARRVAAALG